MGDADGRDGASRDAPDTDGVAGDTSPSAGGARTSRLAGGGLFVLGVAAAAAAALVEPGGPREVLVALAGVGLYGALLVALLRPGSTADPDPVDRVYRAYAATGVALRRDLDLPADHAYIPAETLEPGFAPVYLVVGEDEDGPGDDPADGDPAAAGDGLRPVFGGQVRTGRREAAGATEDAGGTDDADASEAAEATDDARTTTTPQGTTDGGGPAPGDPGEAAVGPGERPGRRDATDAITLYPTGSALFDAYEAIAAGDLADDPVELGDQLAEAATAGLDLAADVDVAVDRTAGAATLTVRDPRFGTVTGFDHPLASFLAVGFALGLDRPVSLDAARSESQGVTGVTLEWATEGAAR